MNPNAALRRHLWALPLLLAGCQFNAFNSAGPAPATGSAGPAVAPSAAPSAAPRVTNPRVVKMNLMWRGKPITTPGTFSATDMRSGKPALLALPKKQAPSLGFQLLQDCTSAPDESDYAPTQGPYVPTFNEPTSLVLPGNTVTISFRDWEPGEVITIAYPDSFTLAYRLAQSGCLDDSGVAQTVDEASTLASDTFAARAAEIFQNGTLSSTQSAQLASQLQAVTDKVRAAVGNDETKLKELSDSLKLVRENPAQRETVLNSLGSNLGIREALQELEQAIDDAKEAADNNPDTPDNPEATEAPNVITQPTADPDPIVADNLDNGDDDEAPLTCGTDAPAVTSGGSNFDPKLTLSYGTALGITVDEGEGANQMGRIVARLNEADFTFNATTAANAANLLAGAKFTPVDGPVRALSVAKSTNSLDTNNTVLIEGLLGSGTLNSALYTGVLNAPVKRVATVQIFRSAPYLYLAITYNPASGAAASSDGGVTSMTLINNLLTKTATTTNALVEFTSQNGDTVTYCRSF